MMNGKKSLLVLGGLMVLILVSAWAVENQASRSVNTPQDFDPTNPKDYPQTNIISMEIIGLARIGQVYMLEGIENETSPVFNPSSRTWDVKDNTLTSYPRLVLHGVFDKLMRDWRDEVISGKVTKRDIRVYLTNSAGRRVLLVRFYNAFPVRFSLPPLSVDGATRYMERVEFVYDNYTITNG